MISELTHNQEMEIARLLKKYRGKSGQHWYGMIQAIKYIREQKGWGLQGSKEVCESVAARYDIPKWKD